jgi:hypothetical protein
MNNSVNNKFFLSLLTIFLTPLIFLVLKFSYVNATSPDAIALRVIPNPKHYSALMWYKEQNFKGSPQSIIVDGYDAIRDGRTVYVNAANVNTALMTLYTNIYLISYNQNADDATVDIVGRLLEKWKFNTNINTTSACSESVAKQCFTDSDCKDEGYCQSLKARITRDTKRLSDIAEMKIKLTDYWGANSLYPALTSGTYISGKTISTWPSWKDALSRELQYTLPMDPINELGPCGGYDAITCWNQDTKKFADPTSDGIFNLPNNSAAYVYQAKDNGMSYDLCSNMESGLVTEDNGNCTGNIIANIAPVIIKKNLPFTNMDKKFEGYFLASNPDGDILTWSINTSMTTWTGWSGGPPILKKSVVNNQVMIYAPDTGPSGTYNINISVSDGRGGSDSKNFSIIINLCQDNDGDGVALNGGAVCGPIDCDDSDKNNYPGNTETCDGSDNNCDTVADEGCDNDGDGYCDAGILMYNNNSMCTNTVFPGNGNPGNDCDDTNAGINKGATETAATCNNGIDEDCSGADLSCAMICTDNDGDNYGNPGSAGCLSPQTDCNDTNPAINPGVPDTNCNNVDENCNGANDENYPASPTTCGVGGCASTGNVTCVAGAVVNTCVAGIPAPNDASCNNVDDDCNGAKDEDYVSGPTTCGVGVCASTGVKSCAGGTEINSCVAGPTTGTDNNCNGVDENCNGTNDENFPATPTTCGVGACASTGLATCVAGAPGNTCVAGIPAPNDASCNNVDDDCNGAKDEDYVPGPTTCGVGVCASTGVKSCAGGTEINSCVAGPTTGTDNNCNGVDENCNGTNDENYPASPTTCGVGACAKAGNNTCVAGAVVNTCVAGAPGLEGPGNVPNCSDGIDNDCDGQTDSADNNCAYCGDSIIQSPNGVGQNEKCDDGNMIAGDGCDWNCQTELSFTDNFNLGANNQTAVIGGTSVQLGQNSVNTTLTQTDNTATIASPGVQGGWGYPASAFSNTTITGSGAGASVQLTPTPKTVIYLDSTARNGNLGGRSGADATCASSPSKPSNAISGSVHAFISVNAADEIRDMPSTYGYNSSNPIYWYNASTGQSIASVANNWADMLDGTISNSQQTGTGLLYYPWSGSLPDGSLKSFYNCNGWTNSTNTIQGQFTNYANTNSLWLESAATTCDVPTNHVVRCIASIPSASWSAPVSVSSTNEIYAAGYVYTKDDLNHFYAIWDWGGGGGVIKFSSSGDGGQNWSSPATIAGPAATIGTGNLKGIGGYGNNIFILYIDYYDLKMAVNTNNGVGGWTINTIWTPLDSVSGSASMTVANNMIYVVYTAGDNKSYIKTSANGTVWSGATMIDNSMMAQPVIYADNSNIYFARNVWNGASYDFKFSRSALSPLSWTTTTLNAGTASSFTELFSYGTNVYLISRSPTGTFRFRRSTDGGATWPSFIDVATGGIGGIPGIYTNDGINIYAIIANNIYKSTDSGSSWSQDDSNIGNGSNSLTGVGNNIYRAFVYTQGAAPYYWKFMKYALTYAASGTYTSYADAGAGASSYTWNTLSWNQTLTPGSSISVKVKTTATATAPSFSSGTCNKTSASGASDSIALTASCRNSSDRYIWYEFTLNSGALGATTPTIDQVQASVDRNSYFSTGTYTSSSLTPAGTITGWSIIKWINTLPVGTTISIKARTDADGNFADAPAWGGCSSIVNGNSIFSGGCSNNSQRYIQVQAILNTPDTLLTPVLNEIRIYYNP